METPPGTIENEVLAGHNGYLFLAGGAHRVADFFTGKRQIPEKSFAAFRENLLGRQAWAARNNTQYLHMIMPDKQSVIPEEWPLTPPIKIGRLYMERNQDLDFILYPDRELAEAKTWALTRVDTHISDEGALLMAAYLVERFSGESQVDRLEALRASPRNVTRTSGDLGHKLTPRVTDDKIMLELPAVGPCYQNEGPGMRSGGVALRFNKSAPYRKRVALFGDSFGGQITRCLQQWYSEVYFFRTGEFAAEIADLCKPDILITENVERYLDNCPRDELRRHFLLYRRVTPDKEPSSEEFINNFSAVLSYPREPYQQMAARLGLEPPLA